MIIMRKRLSLDPNIQHLDPIIHMPFGQKKLFGWNEVGRSFSFGLAVMRQFFEQKWRWHGSFRNEIAVPAFLVMKNMCASKTRKLNAVI